MIDGVVANVVVVDYYFTLINDDDVDDVTLNFAFDLCAGTKHGYGAQMAR